MGLGCSLGTWDPEFPRRLAHAAKIQHTARRPSTWWVVGQEVEWTEVKGGGMVPNTITLPRDPPFRGRLSVFSSLGLVESCPQDWLPGAQFGDPVRQAYSLLWIQGSPAPIVPSTQSYSTHSEGGRGVGIHTPQPLLSQLLVSAQTAFHYCFELVVKSGLFPRSWSAF